jgi:hypothetical protein
LSGITIAPTRSIVGSLGREAGGKYEDTELLVEASGSEDAGTKKEASNRSAHDWASRIDSRSNGDRSLAKSHAHASTEGDEDEELDISKYSVINGIIVHRDVMVGPSGLTKEQGTRLGRIGCGSHGVGGAERRTYGLGGYGERRGYRDGLRAVLGCEMF